jgi:hypothetical protein
MKYKLLSERIIALGLFLLKGKYKRERYGNERTASSCFVLPCDFK